MSFTCSEYFAKGDHDHVGSYFKRPCAGIFVEYDDIYISYALTRVELGNNPVFEASEHLEVQPPSEWSDGSIEVTFNRGTFQAGDTAYLFVINAAGNPSPGFPIEVK